MTQFSRDELLELAPLFVIGATTPEEGAALEAAMRTDAALAAEVESFRAVPDALVSSLVSSGASSGASSGGASPAPSAALRERLLTAARSARPRLSDAPRRPLWMPLALAASLLAALGLGAYSLRLRDALESRAIAVAALEARLGQRERTLNTVLEADQALYLVRLQPIAGGTGPGVQFFWNAKQGRAVAHVFRLPTAPAGRDYQIWALVDGKPVSLAVFDSDAEGHALVEDFTLPASTAGVSAVLISLEPTGGSPQPTTAPFLAGAMQPVATGG